MTVKTSTAKALLLSASLLAALPLVGCAGSTNETSDEEAAAADVADGDGDENVASTSSAYSVSSTNYDLGSFGGTGGVAATIRCPTGSVVVGLHGRAGNVIDQVGLICAPLRADGTLGVRSTTGTRGGTGGSPFHLECRTNEVVRGFGFTWGNYVNTVRLQCSKAPFTSTSRTTDWVGGTVGFGGFQNPECPGYYVVNSIAVRTGNVVDAMNPRCTYVGTH